MWFGMVWYGMYVPRLTDEDILVAFLQLYPGRGVGDDVVGERVLRWAAVRNVRLVGTHVGVQPV